jgi:hypothetical protein
VQDLLLCAKHLFVEAGMAVAPSPADHGMSGLIACWLKERPNKFHKRNFAISKATL